MVCEVYKQGVGQYVNVVLDWFGLAASCFLYICIAADRADHGNAGVGGAYYLALNFISSLSKADRVKLARSLSW